MENRLLFIQFVFSHCQLCNTISLYFFQENSPSPCYVLIIIKFSILVLICIFEFISIFHLLIWAIDLQNLLQFFHVYTLWEGWMFKRQSFGLDDSSLLINKDLNLQYCFMNQTLYSYSMFLEFSYYIVMCVDLIITLKWPFVSGKSRLIYYHLFAVCYSSFLFGLTWKHIDTFCNNTVIEDFTDEFQEPPKLTIAIPTVLAAEVN